MNKKNHRLPEKSKRTARVEQKVQSKNFNLLKKKM